MQPAAPDPAPAAPPAPPPDDLVRAIREVGLEDAFRPALDAGPAMHQHMVRARVVSARMVALQRTERIGFHTASIGEEAAIVAAVLATRSTDWIFPGARDWYAALARGMPLHTYVHHAFGSAEDPTKGHASPDHAPARAFHVVPPSGVAGAHLPQAAGAAWAAKIKKEDVAVLSLFGAEVAGSGDFHNALNFAGVFRLPVVFVCRTRFAPTGAAGPSTTDRAAAYGLASARVDGSDALAVWTVVRAALARASEGKGATFIDVVTRPMSGLASIDDARLAAGDVLDLGEDDPIVRLHGALVRERRIDPGTDTTTSIARDARVEVDAAIAEAERVGAPLPSTIFEHVFADVPPHLAAQRRTLR